MEKLAQFYKALGDETRLKIIALLFNKELCVCDIFAAFNLSQPAISHHLKILKQAGVVNDNRVGKWIYYGLNPEALSDVDLFWQNMKRGAAEKIPREPRCAD
ncbi:MAG TPA: metalloregulator ArsR/SmtB family transcription factor [Negativicutes bacterium]|nr:metalloregulator ArsR/SmtB family transcription factor [Negativicutes bacterium]